MHSDYSKAFGIPVPRGLAYAVSTGKISREQRDALITQAIKTKTPVEGYELLKPGDPARV